VKGEDEVTFTVYAELAPEVSKKLDRLAKRAAGYGVPFSYSISEEHPQTVDIREVDTLTKTVHTVSAYTVPAVDIKIECDGLIRANGWTVRAKVEHGDKGNIVTGFSGCKAKPEWYTAAPNCDHCHTNRYRGVTFFVEHENGSIRQVGRTCLKEYTGISPATAAMWAEVRDLLDKDMSYTSSEWEMGRYVQMYEVLGILAHACDVVKEFGYRKSAEPGSTREKVMGLVLSDEQPSAEGMEKATLIRDWLVSLEQVVRDEDAARVRAWAEAEENADEFGQPAAVKHTPDTVSNLERNCITLVLSGYAKLSHIGQLAYMPVAYDQYLERKASEERRREDGARSEYVGKVGQRITLKAETVALLSSWDGYYGTTWLYKFVDLSGNVYIWFASRPCAAENGAIIKATVKDHKERDGVKQTIVTRCCVAA